MLMASVGSSFIKIFLSLVLLFGVIWITVALLDVASYTASDARTVPHDSAVGKALIVYDPGLMGTGKRTADWMASDLSSRGYEVTVAGIRSEGITDATGYNILIVISPTSAGNPMGLVTGYLKEVRTGAGTVTGVFGIRGLMGDDSSGAMFQILERRTIHVKAKSSITPWDEKAEESSYEFVYDLLK